MIEFIFAIAIAFFAHDVNVETQRDFYYIELHDNSRFDENEFMQTYDACYAINDTQYAIDKCVQFAIDSYSRTNA